MVDEYEDWSGSPESGVLPELHWKCTEIIRRGAGVYAGASKAIGRTEAHRDQGLFFGPPMLGGACLIVFAMPALAPR